VADRPARNEFESLARRELVAIVRRMLEGQLPFMEGAGTVRGLQYTVGGVDESDDDFMAFNLIQSETDALPHQAQRHLWAQSALMELEPSIRHAQEWASGFAPAACRNLLARFAETSEGTDGDLDRAS